MKTYEVTRAFARALCKLKGCDPDSATMDVYCPDDPDYGYPWAGFRKDAETLIKSLEEQGIVFISLVELDKPS